MAEQSSACKIIRGSASTPSEGPDEEDVVWMEAFIEKMGQASSEEKAFFAERRRLGIGVGLDITGNLVSAKPGVTECDCSKLR